MSSVLTPKCPRCRKALRMPAAWVGQAVRCKFCQSMFQSQQRPRAQAPVALPAAPAAVRTPALAVNGAAQANPFGLDGDPGAPLARLPVRRKGGRWWMGALVFGGVAAAIAIVGVVAWPHLSNLFSDKKDPDPGRKLVAEGKDKTKDIKKEIDPGLKKKDDLAKKKDDLTKKKDDEGKDTDKMDDPPKMDPIPPKDPPKKKTFPIKKTDPGKDPVKTVASGAFPRRALIINVSNYLLLNPLHYGSPEERAFPGSSGAVLARRLSLPPFNVPANQIFELSDGAAKATAVVKPVIETMIMDFCDTSREQDRIMVLFTGHAVNHEKKCYLIPVEGHKDKAETLVPLDWVMEQLAKCKARQKVLVLDVFRFPPARGEELPGTGAMTEEFEAALLNPPAGVQVWWSASKDQQSIEFEGGSVFLQALSHTLKEWNAPGKLGGAGFAQPQEPLPIEDMLPRVNQRLKELLSVQKLEQVSRLSGKEAEGGKAYDAAEPVAQAIAPKQPNIGAAAAGKAIVENILGEINLAPPAKATLRPIQFANLPIFKSAVLENYKSDYTSLAELKAQLKRDKDKYPLRAAIMETVEGMNKDLNIVSRERVTSPINDGVKKQILAEQDKPGLMIFELTQKLTALKELQDKRDTEPSKRWQAHYDYTMARLQARIVYIYEYNYVLANVRTDSLPELDTKIHNGWRIGSRDKIGVPATEAKDMAKNVKKLWKKIQDEYPDTPWALMAARESMVALGMEWRASRD